MTDFKAALGVLTNAGVRFIIIGGAAATAHKLGDLDFLGEIVGGGRFEDLAPHSIEVELFGLTCLCLDLPKLVEVKRATGRPKDLEALAELESLLEHRRDS